MAVGLQNKNTFKVGTYKKGGAYGPEEVKWELGFGQIFTGKMGFRSLGLGITNKETIKLGLEFQKLGKQ